MKLFDMYLWEIAIYDALFFMSHLNVGDIQNKF